MTKVKRQRLPPADSGDVYIVVFGKGNRLVRGRAKLPNCYFLTPRTMRRNPSSRLDQLPPYDPCSKPCKTASSAERRGCKCGRKRPLRVAMTFAVVIANSPS